MFIFICLAIFVLVSIAAVLGYLIGMQVGKQTSKKVLKQKRKVEQEELSRLWAKAEICISNIYNLEYALPILERIRDKLDELRKEK